MRRSVSLIIRDYRGLLSALAACLALFYAGFFAADRLMWRHFAYPAFLFSSLAAVFFLAIWGVVRYAFMRKSVETSESFQQRLIHSFEHSDAGVCWTDKDGCITNCNDAFAKLVGHSREELPGLQFNALIHPDERQDSTSLWRNAMNGGKRHYSFTRKFLRSDGKVLWGNVALSFILEGSGGLGGIVFVQDTTREQEALRSLEASERKLRRLLEEVQRNEQKVSMLARAVESTTDSIVITELDGSIVYVNPHFEELTGYTRAEVYGKSPGILNSGRQPKEFYANLWRTLKAGGVWKGRFINRRKNGSLYTEEATIAPVRDASGQAHKYVAVKRDVTRLEELQSQLRHSQKMEAVGQLAGGIAHDINNVLQVITLASHLALKSDSSDFKDARIKETVAAAMKGAGVIRQLLAFGRRQLMRIEVLSLNDVIKETAKLLTHLLREDIQLRLDLDPTLGNVKADPVQITQVILNLAVNARDAMPYGGILEIASSNFEASEESVSTRTRLAAGRYVRLVIRDTGTGMDEATKFHIFEPFFTTKEIGKGTGLGLSTVYGIVTQSEGHIEFDSALGVGTTFTIYLPRTEDPIAAAAQKAGAQSVLPGSEPYSVLVVEDEDMVRNSIAEALRREGFRVHTSASSQEAWETAIRERPSLVISDVMMAGMKGIELVEHLKKQNPSIQTILMSGYSDEELVLRATEIHGSVFIPKPFTMSQLVESALRLCKAKH